MYAISHLGTAERIALFGCSTSSLLSSLASCRTYNLLGPNLKKLFLHTKHQNDDYHHLPELHKYINHIHIPGHPFIKLEHDIINLNHLDQPDMQISSHIKSFCLDHPNTITILKLIYDLMYELNNKLCDELYINSVNSFDNILTEKIKEEFVPLNYQHIYAIFNEVFPQEEESVYIDRNSNIRQTILNFLEFDVSWIVSVSSDEYSPYHYSIYPKSIKHLIMYNRLKN
jgi:hypothetical protein